MNRFVGICGGIFAGVIAVVIARTTFDLGLTILPVGQLILQLSPGIILGGVLGGLFPKVFAWFIVFLPTN